MIFAVQKLLEGGADVAQPNEKGQNLMEVLNPKCEIYKIIKKFLAARPGGQVCPPSFAFFSVLAFADTSVLQRKLQLISDEVVLACSVQELPVEIQRTVDKSGAKLDPSLPCASQSVKFLHFLFVLGLTREEINSNWTVFCSVMRSGTVRLIGKS